MADNSEAEAIFEVFFTEYWIAAAIALLVYDYILTFSYEVTLFWMGGRLSGATILFLLNRYVTLAAQIVNVVPPLLSVEVAESGTASLTSVIAILEEPLTAIITSRFLIDLQRTQRKLAGSSRSVSLGELEFQPQTSRNTSRFIGSLGAQLSLHEDGNEENEVEDTS
ncbi:hypothetical protein DICSQDRAFT_173211 [Dichomitus squalens LYAD-421 SS1]|uniref:DUF6533 domain-containing protein n=1 Tax=Dichomitus squalens (strain LYAD-421) TaxID=732165 RepID=R7SQT3_DICSQ|nr:uncharacterized protein DICSQDRAFT_173211 [Dichomitus squalens LYAD-421 SS1]EJF58115.1 hypothetical protein DICSQDRAFT_173211 [Dichomitus squalens LYAD-421 SS1]